MDNNAARIPLFVRLLSVLLLLYIFLVSISLFGASFKLFGKSFATELIQTCSDPLVGLFVGIFATSLIQSSSTTTSLIVGFVGGGALTVEVAIPMIMGANIGTTVTNLLVSMGFVARKDDFRRAFGGAVVHDFFNIYSVALLLPLELMFHPIQKSAIWLTNLFATAGGAKFTSPLKIIIKPAVHGIQDFFSGGLGLGETGTGVAMMILAVVVLVASLLYLVKTMRVIIVERAERVIDRYLFRNDFTAFILGLVITVAVQSSSVSTSLIVPLVGAGIVTLHRCFPFTLGANLGTTCTALLASLATVTVTGSGEVHAMGVTAAFAHLIFNLLGSAVFYPLRRLPIRSAQMLADLAAESKRWAIIFLLAVFFVVPFLVIMIGRALAN
jgi:solute carrier family 34 (sodium-dependent phosphate cotransporter)